MRVLWLIAAATLILTTQPRGAWGSNPPTGIPVGSIVAFLPDPAAGQYTDLAGLKRWLGEQGWAICDGSDGTPDLNFRMLLGTVHAEEAGAYLGSRTHDHLNRGETGSAVGRERSFLTGRGHAVRAPEGGHRHRVENTTEPAEHLPLSMRALFIMRVR